MGVRQSTGVRKCLFTCSGHSLNVSWFVSLLCCCFRLFLQSTTAASQLPCSAQFPPPHNPTCSLTLTYTRFPTLWNQTLPNSRALPNPHSSIQLVPSLCPTNLSLYPRCGTNERMFPLFAESPLISKPLPVATPSIICFIDSILVGRHTVKATTFSESSCPLFS